MKYNYTENGAIGWACSIYTLKRLCPECTSCLRDRQK